MHTSVIDIGINYSFCSNFQPPGPGDVNLLKEDWVVFFYFISFFSINYGILFGVLTKNLSAQCFIWIPSPWFFFCLYFFTITIYLFIWTPYQWQFDYFILAYFKISYMLVCYVEQLVIFSPLEWQTSNIGQHMLLEKLLHQQRRQQLHTNDESVSSLLQLHLKIFNQIFLW